MLWETILALAICLVSASSHGAASVTLAWDRNSEADVSGYIIHFGLGSGQYTASTNVGNVTTNVVSGLTLGATYFFAVTAYNTNGLESEPSNEVSYTVPTNGPSAFVGLPSQLKINKNSPVTVPFTIGGVSSSNLVVQVTSSRPTLLPVRATTLLGSGTNRTLVLSPVRDKSGSVVLTVSCTQGPITLRHSIAVTVTASNNAPTLTIPTALSVWRRTALPLIGVQARDVDATAKTTANFRMILTAAHGTIKLRTTVAGGITTAQVRGNGTGRLVINAPLRAINRTLAAPGGISYLGNLNYVGPDSVLAVVSDRGNTGIGGAKSCSAGLAITVQGDAYDLWRNTNFAEADLKLSSRGPSVWGDNADPDSDGRDNLTEFALGSNPYVKQPSTNGLTTALLQTNAMAHLSMTFTRRASQSLVTYVPEVSSDGHDWNAAAVEVQQVQPIDGTFESVTCRDTVPVRPGQLRLMRMRLIRSTP